MIRENGISTGISVLRRYALGYNKAQVERLYTLPVNRSSRLADLTAPNFNKIRERTGFRRR